MKNSEKPKDDFQDALKRVEDKKAMRLFYPEKYLSKGNFDYEKAEEILRKKGYGQTVAELKRILD
jgi:hypothetical protein